VANALNLGFAGGLFCQIGDRDAPKFLLAFLCRAGERLPHGVSMTLLLTRPTEELGNVCHADAGCGLLKPEPTFRPTPRIHEARPGHLLEDLRRLGGREIRRLGHLMRLQGMIGRRQAA
jgi:hypothetical protein